ncbi:MAG: DUF4258 domain-containing protein [bacterium]|nr:DUF4258 domain-containing protein [bacterium]
MQIRFTTHALRKFSVLRRHGFLVSKRQVVRAVEKPDRVDYSRLPLLIAQVDWDKRRVFRVVYRVKGDIKVIITFYPGMKSQYEKEN